MGAQLGDDVVFADVGDLVFKPRSRWHTFWNAKDEPCRIPRDRPREHPAPVREHGLTFAMPGD